MLFKIKGDSAFFASLFHSEHTLHVIN